LPASVHAEEDDDYLLKQLRYVFSFQSVDVVWHRLQKVDEQGKAVSEAVRQDARVPTSFFEGVLSLFKQHLLSRQTLQFMLAVSAHVPCVCGWWG
jgi:hypothetical protein